MEKSINQYAGLHTLLKSTDQSAPSRGGRCEYLKGNQDTLEGTREAVGPSHPNTKDNTKAILREGTRHSRLYGTTHMLHATQFRTYRPTAQRNTATLQPTGMHPPTLWNSLPAGTKSRNMVDFCLDTKALPEESPNGRGRRGYASLAAAVAVAAAAAGHGMAGFCGFRVFLCVCQDGAWQPGSTDPRHTAGLQWRLTDKKDTTKNRVFRLMLFPEIKMAYIGFCIARAT